MDSNDKKYYESEIKRLSTDKNKYANDLDIAYQLLNDCWNFIENAGNTDEFFKLRERYRLIFS